MLAKLAFDNQPLYSSFKVFQLHLIFSCTFAQVLQQLKEPGSTLRRQIPDLDATLLCQRETLERLSEKATSLSWDLLTALPPLILVQPESLDENIEDRVFHYWVEGSSSELIYFRPVLYRNYTGVVAAKGWVANTYQHGKTSTSE